MDNFSPILPFRQTTDKLLQTLSEIPEEDFNRKPNAESWSAAQVGEHLLKSYGVTEMLLAPAEKTDRAADEQVKMIRDLFLDFSIRMQSPEEILPSEDPIDQTELLDQLKIRFREFEEIMDITDLQQLCTNFVVPEFGAFTRLEWIWFAIYHTQRHVQQLSQINLKTI
ncbi:MAG TPA: DinB family protein [Dyadobacter sp.]|jgi:hypothetical protein|nr:DinB family protein [Dyadobacter sp.]